MKYLKLYESFKDDYLSNYQRIRSEYDQKKKENFQKTKELVDEHLYDFIDFNLVEDQTEYKYHEFSLKYLLKFDFIDFDDEFPEFLNNLKSSVERLEEYTGFSVRFDQIKLIWTVTKLGRVSIYGDKVEHHHLINYGNNSTIQHIVKWKEYRDSLKKEARNDYKSIQFRLKIS